MPSIPTRHPYRRRRCRQPDSWPSSPRPHGVAAIYDGNAPPLLKPESVNIIAGNSVLHHILHYEDSVRNWARLLSRPGLMMFGEPIKEGWAYWITIISLLVGLAQSDAIKISAKSQEILLRHRRMVEQRLSNPADCSDGQAIRRSAPRR